MRAKDISPYNSLKKTFKQNNAIVFVTYSIANQAHYLYVWLCIEFYLYIKTYYP